MTVSEGSGRTHHGLDVLRGRQLRDELLRHAVVILGLSAVAVTQPVLEMFGSNPEFFVAGHYTSNQIVWFALIVTLVPPVLLLVPISVATVIDRRAGRVMFTAGIAVLVFAFVLVLLRTLDVDETMIVIPLGLVATAVATGLLLRIRAVRLFVSYLAAANVLFLATFLFFSDSAGLLTGGGSASSANGVDVTELVAPVVVVVFDELPVTTLMRPDGTINADRYPGFAALADIATWHRNASSASMQTLDAIPSLLTGSLADPADTATYLDHPRSLFSLFGGAVPVDRYEVITQLCPPLVCEPMPPQPLRQALSDAAVVYGHEALPESLRDKLPRIDEAWGDFERADDGDARTRTDKERADESVLRRWQDLRAKGEIEPAGQAGVLRRRIAAIDSKPRLHYTHTMLPHVPWMLSKTGRTASFELEWSPFALFGDPQSPDYEFRLRVYFQMHSLQTGAADALVGELLDHLQTLPNWEDTLLVVTADHGGSFATGDLFRSNLNGDGIEEGHRVPLFVKRPGQAEGEVRDDVAQSIDVVPSIVDLLGIEVGGEWDFDGHSLYDGSERTVDPVVSEEIEPALDVARRNAERFPYDDGWLGLAAVGDHGELVGKRVAAVGVGAPSSYVASLDDADLFGDLPTSDGRLPFALVGTARGPDDQPPPEFLVAINGRLAGVVGGYRAKNDEWEFVGYVAELYARGRNEVKLYEVTRTGVESTLHEVRQ